MDDTRITATTPEVRVAFHTAWAEAFGEKISARPLSEDFTGLRHTPIGPRTVAVSCGGIVARLESLLGPHPLLNEKCDWPLATMAFAELNEGLSPLVPEMLEAMQPILGTIGFIVGHVRPDAYFAYAVLCRHVTAGRLSKCAVRSVIRLGHYLVATRELCLHLTTPELTRAPDGSTSLDLFDCYSDSSHGNGELGASIGGFVLMARGSPSGVAGAPEEGAAGGGALAWRCGIQHEGDDSSAAAELRMATLAYKFTLAARFLLTELDVGVAPAGPTLFHLDAQAVLDGTTCERLAKKSRWMAMRYAMLRWGMHCRTIDPRKLHSSRNPSDGLTKCLVGAAFLAARARLLGHPVPVVEHGEAAARPTSTWEEAIPSPNTGRRHGGGDLPPPAPTPTGVETIPSPNTGRRHGGGGIPPSAPTPAGVKTNPPSRKGRWRGGGKASPAAPGH